ncbi:hypothetical protein D3C83_34450 [compost metagenome]
MLDALHGQLEQPVARLVAEVVVDDLEAVRVDHEHAERAGVALGLPEDLLGGEHQSAHVHHAGQLVGFRQQLHLAV